MKLQREDNLKSDYQSTVYDDSLSFLLVYNYQTFTCVYIRTQVSPANTEQNITETTSGSSIRQ